ncbi:GNAT family N-acetyltransferase [Streptomyces tauricus]|uniref:GNAT family N-acetyltransferase n=1 Tax=Streptomyces tauricus TaxID=68274 RepID=UPI0022448B3D|nr:GNAT family N-acetyltransferase [Streptomyces tauricus]MCW8101722.1 GNAT family N-acetyltransferase [Streptomyces tauricus]
MAELPDLSVPHTVRTHLGADVLTILTRHWPALYTQDLEATPFQSPAWLTAAARLLPTTATPLVLTATTASGRIIAALALTRDREHTRVQFRPLSAPHLSHLRLTGPHADDDAVAHGFALHMLLLHHTGAEITLPGLRADTTLGRAVQTVGQGSLSADTSLRPSLVLPFRAEDLAPSRRRAHVRRCRHWARLSATRTVTYQRSHHQQDLRTGLEVLAALHELSPGPAGVVPWHRVVPALGTAGAFTAVLRVDGTPVAAQLCLTRSRHAYSTDQAAHPAYRHLGPANALLRQLLDDLAHQGFHSLDPGRASHPARSAAPHPPIRLAA